MISQFPEWVILTFHTCRANSNGGVLPRTIIGPKGAQMVALINSSLEPSESYYGDDTLCLLQERDEARALYSNVVHDLGLMDFHLNTMQDTLTISENRVNTIQMRLAEAEVRITGDLFEATPIFTILISQNSNCSSFEFTNLVGAVGKSSIGCRLCCTIGQCQRCRTGDAYFNQKLITKEVSEASSSRT